MIRKLGKAEQEKIYSYLYLLQQSVVTVTTEEAHKTRQHMTEELGKARSEIIKFIKEENMNIIDCIKYNAVTNIEIISLIGVSITIFSLLISFLLKVHIINPFLAILFLVASLGFYTMVKIEQRKQIEK